MREIEVGDIIRVKSVDEMRQSAMARGDYSGNIYFMNDNLRFTKDMWYLCNGEYEVRDVEQSGSYPYHYHLKDVLHYGFNRYMIEPIEDFRPSKNIDSEWMSLVNGGGYASD